MDIEVRELLLEDGSSPFARWFERLDPQAAAKVAVAIVRMRQGNFSNIKWFQGIGEFKIDWGPGYRIYLAKEGLQMLLLLGGGTKRAQQRDVDRALALWRGYTHRKDMAKRK